MKTGIERIRAERQRQLLKYDAEHDAQHEDCELAIAAAWLISGLGPHPDWAEALAEKYDHGEEEWLQTLAVAGALIAAEIDRLQRNGGAK